MTGLYYMLCCWDQGMKVVPRVVVCSMYDSSVGQWKMGCFCSLIGWNDGKRLDLFHPPAAKGIDVTVLSLTFPERWER